MAVTPSRKLANNGIPRNPLGLESDFTIRHGVRVGDNNANQFAPYSVLQMLQLRVTSQVPGVVRMFWRATPRYTGAPRILNWTHNSWDAAGPMQGDLSTTRLNYRIDSPLTASLHYGNQLSRPMSRPTLSPSVAAAAPRVVTNGNVRNRPVLRVRIPSFGSRVPALNSAGPGTQE